MRTLVVDDEPIARRILIDELEDLPKVEVAGEAANGKQALLKIAELKPDLVFSGFADARDERLRSHSEPADRAATCNRHRNRFRPTRHPRV